MFLLAGSPALAANVGLADRPDLQTISAVGEREILRSPVLEVAGTAHPDVVIVEYFDYNCGYCKRYAPTLAELRARDPKITVVYKDWPILGALSVYGGAVGAGCSVAGSVCRCPRRVARRIAPRAKRTGGRHIAGGRR